MRSLPASSLRGQTFRTVEASYRKAGHVRQGSRDCVTVSRRGPRTGSANFAAGRALSCHSGARDCGQNASPSKLLRFDPFRFEAHVCCSPHRWDQGGDIVRRVTATMLLPGTPRGRFRLAPPPFSPSAATRQTRERLLLTLRARPSREDGAEPSPMSSGDHSLRSPQFSSPSAATRQTRSASTGRVGPQL